MDWNDNLAYWRVEPEPNPGMARFIVHSEMPYAVYGYPPSGCRRSARDVFLVDCSARTVAQISHVEYEGRGAVGRRIKDYEFGPDKRKFQSALTGFYRQVAEVACIDVNTLISRSWITESRADLNR